MTFLEPAAPSPDAQRLFDEDVAELGYVMNATRLWAHDASIVEGIFGLLRQLTSTYNLSLRQRGILVTACASAFGDSPCALAWGGKLAAETDPGLAASVVLGTDDGLTEPERAMAAWARAVARDPNATTAADVQTLRDNGFSDGEIFAITTFVALRLAFSTVNDALGALPDAQFRTTVPPEVLEAVTFGRPIAD
jgi:alkylhydroperoxidase family enzyme